MSSDRIQRNLFLHGKNYLYILTFDKLICNIYGYSMLKSDY